MSFKLYTRIFFSIVLISILTVMIINVIIDPLGVFNSRKYTHLNITNNSVDNHQRIYKFYDLMYYKPSSIILGTSRGAILQANNFSRYTHDKVYNLSLSASTPYEQYEYALYCMENFDIKNIIITVDFFSYNPSLKPTPDFDKNRFKNNTFYDYKKNLLTMDTLQLSFKTFNKYITDNNQAIFLEDGSENHIFEAKHLLNMSQLEKDKIFNNTLEGFAHEKQLYNSPEFKNPHSIDKSIHYLKLLVEKARSKNINFKLVILPIHMQQFKLIYSMGLGNTYEYWKRELVNISDYIDFTGYNFITNNRKYFRDSSHMLASLSPVVAQSIFNEDDLNSTNGFGTLVNKDNIFDHIEQQRADILK